MAIDKRVYVKTHFLTGFITEVIDGSKRGWRDTAYYRVKVYHPLVARGTSHIIRLDEITDLPPSPYTKVIQ